MSAPVGKGLGRVPFIEEAHAHLSLRVRIGTRPKNVSWLIILKISNENVDECQDIASFPSINYDQDYNKVKML